MVDRREEMRLDRVDFLILKARAVRSFIGERAEGAIALVPPGTPRDLRHLGYGQPPRAPSVELAQRGEGDMRDVHVEPHADRVGCDEIIDFARLEHCDLRVARARRKRAHHDRRATAHPAQHFGDRVNLLGREGHDRRSRRQAR